MLPRGSVFAILDDTEPGGSDRPVTRRSLDIAQATTCTVERAKAYISGALAAMLDLGHGSGPMDHGFDFRGKGFAEEQA